MPNDLENILAIVNYSYKNIYIEFMDMKTIKMGAKRLVVLGIIGLLLPLSLLMLSANISAKTIIVDDSGGADYTTIEDAIDNALPGDTIFVRSGVYRISGGFIHSLIIDTKSITLKGEDKYTTILSTEKAIQVSAGGVTITGFTISNYGEDRGIEIEGDSVTIRDNIFTGIKDDAIGVFDCEGVIIKDNLITNNTGHYEESLHVYNEADGILLGSGSLRVTIEGNTISNNNGAGIYITDSSNNGHLIYHNNFINNNPNAEEEGTYVLNDWDNGKEGNYWDDYNGVDNDGDGIGDTSYRYGCVDNYPLMSQWTGSRDRDKGIPGFEIAFLIIAIISIIMLRRKSHNY